MLMPVWKVWKGTFFFLPPFSPSLSPSVWGFVLQVAGLTSALTLAACQLVFLGKKSLKGIFFNRNNGNTDVKHGGKIIVFIGVALSLACTNLWTCMHTALRPRNVAQCFEFVLLQHRKQGETRFWFLKAWRVWWNCWTSPLCVCVCVSLCTYVCLFPQVLWRMAWRKRRRSASPRRMSSWPKMSFRWRRTSPPSLRLRT